MLTLIFEQLCHAPVFVAVCGRMLIAINVRSEQTSDQLSNNFSLRFQYLNNFWKTKYSVRKKDKLAFQLSRGHFKALLARGTVTGRLRFGQVSGIFIAQYIFAFHRTLAQLGV